MSWVVQEAHLGAAPPNALPQPPPGPVAFLFSFVSMTISGSPLWCVKVDNVVGTGPGQDGEKVGALQ